MKEKYIIAIDGPSASGKSTTAKRLAKILRYVYIDTGAMYRAVGLKAKLEKIDLEKESDIEKLLNNIKIDIEFKENGNIVRLNEIDVTKRIRDEDISKMASKVSTKRAVREKMVFLQREMGKKGGIVLDGRDIGTVVFPKADFKFFIEADLKERSKRRWKELKSKGIEIDFQEVLKEMKWRDKNDSEREISPLKKAKDATVIDTTNLSIDEQISTILEIIHG